MPGKEPVSEQRFSADDMRPLTRWADAQRYLQEGNTYWLATVRPDARPHVMPVLAVWVDGALHFCSGEASRKSQNLARNSLCVITVGKDVLDVVVEAEAVKVFDETRLQQVAYVHASKY